VSSTAAAGGRRCARGSGEVRARSGLTAAGDASVGARSHVGVLKPRRLRADRELEVAVSTVWLALAARCSGGHGRRLHL
jgi:hypothetical protein